MKEIFLIFWLVAYLRRQLIFQYWWQTKEYRLDRFLVFLKTPEGRSKTELWWFSLKLCLFIFSFFLQAIIFLYLLTLLWENFKFLYELITHQLRRPKITLRSSCFIFTSFIIGGAVIFWSWKDFKLLFLFLTDWLSFIVPLISLFWTNLILKIVLKIQSQKALAILDQSKTKIIAITGSYGKSSTKHLLFELLKENSSTIKTPASYNTPLGIVQTINKDLNPKIKYFICEMGAYKKGEINDLCRIVKPDYAIITGIAPQHLALFGNMENLIKTKYEIAQNLKKEGILFLNVSQSSINPLLALTKKNKIKVITYSFGKDNNQKADFWASLISQQKDSTTFKMVSPQKTFKFTTNITDLSLIENLIGALTVALTLNLPVESLRNIIRNLPEIPSGIKIQKISPNFTLIDDSFNSNPVGFSAAINTLSKFKGFKVVITEGIQELGDKTNPTHVELGKQMKIVDLILTPSVSLVKPLQEGSGQDKQKIILIKPSIKLEKLRKLIKIPAVILLEGRLPLMLVKTINLMCTW